jgi:hypothetical protein
MKLHPKSSLHLILDSGVDLQRRAAEQKRMYNRERSQHLRRLHLDEVEALKEQVILLQSQLKMLQANRPLSSITVAERESIKRLLKENHNLKQRIDDNEHCMQAMISLGHRILSNSNIVSIVQR